MFIPKYRILGSALRSTSLAHQVGVSTLQYKQQILRKVHGAAAAAFADHESILHRTNQASNSKPTYVVKEQPLGTMRPIKVIIIGAGVSGINMVRELKQNSMNVEQVIYDKNPEIGGTWFENCYPGCASDDPSHNYQFSHTPNPGWSSLFSPASEIQKYLLDVCTKYDLRDKIKLSHSVVHAQWEEHTGEWVLKIKNEQTGDVFEDRCNFLLNASGIFNDWKWPDIKGLHSFEGELVHSAKWSKDFDHKNKRVAVIGNGASGVQIVPVLQPDVKNLVHFVRTKAWISPKSKAVEHVHEYEMDDGFKFTEKQVEDFRADPEKYFNFMLKGSPEAAEARRLISSYMEQALEYDETLIKALKPDFPVGCRRVTPGIGYLKALKQPNVDVITCGIEEICPTGIKLSNGEFIEVDAIVCATGFNCSFIPRFPIVGQYGNLQEFWANNSSSAYMSCMVPGMPNYFTFLGPNGPLAHGAIPLISELLAKYLLKFLKKCQLENIHSYRPLPQAVKDYTEHISTFMPRTVWSSNGVRSWYRNGESHGRVLALHPGSQGHFFHMLEVPRWEDFEWKTISEDVEGAGEGEGNSAGGNRFAYLGNGFSTRELGVDGKDSAWYLAKPDEIL